MTVQAGSLRPTVFRVSLDVLVDPDRVFADVHAAVGTALRTAFSADRRSFGQAVSESEVLALTQGVSGVRAATRDRAGAHPGPREGFRAGRGPARPGRALAAGQGRVRKTLEVEPAQLLIIARPRRRLDRGDGAMTLSIDSALETPPTPARPTPTPGRSTTWCR